jgi:hypothetical protein
MGPEPTLPWLAGPQPARSPPPGSPPVRAVAGYPLPCSRQARSSREAPRFLPATHTKPGGQESAAPLPSSADPLAGVASPRPARVGLCLFLKQKDFWRDSWLPVEQLRRGERGTEGQVRAVGFYEGQGVAARCQVETGVARGAERHKDGEHADTRHMRGCVVPD